LNTYALLVQPEISVISNHYKHRLLSKVPAFIGGKLEGITTSADAMVPGWLICLPQMVCRNQTDDISRPAYYHRAKQIADLTRNLKVNILGLGESDYVRWGELLRINLLPTITLGDAYRAGMVRRLLSQSLISKRIPQSQVRVAVTGVGGSLGNICTRVLATMVRKLTVIGISEKAFDFFARQILYETGTSVLLGRDVAREFGETDVLVVTDEGQGGWGEREWMNLRSGAQVIQVSSQIVSNSWDIPKNVCINRLMVSIPRQVCLKSSMMFRAYKSLLRENWPDWLGQLNKGDSRDSNRQLIPASLAEVILLSLETSISPSGKGEDISLKYVDQLDTIGVKLGFIPQLIEQKRSIMGNSYSKNIALTP